MEKNRNSAKSMEEDFSFQKILWQTKTSTKTKTDPTCAISSKSRRFEDIKYDTDSVLLRGGVATKSESQQHQQNQQKKTF